MRDRGLAPQRFLSVHIRHSVEKHKEGQKLGVSLPELPEYDTLSSALAADVKTNQIFLQTASPVALDHYAGYCAKHGLVVSFTNNSRSENDAWGGWQGGAEMEQALVAAVNAHVGSQAAVSVSPDLSLWTHFLSWVFGPTDAELGTVRVCCPPAKCHSLRGGSHVSQLIGASALVRGGGSLVQTRAGCKVNS